MFKKKKKFMFSRAKNGLTGLLSRVPGFNSASSTLSSTLKSKSVFGRAVFVILAIVVFSILMSVGSRIMTYFIQPSNPYLVRGMINANNQKTISTDPTNTGGVYISRSQNQNDGIEFSWSVWINISNLNVGTARFQHIFSKGNNSNGAQPIPGMSIPNNSPGLYIAPGVNDLWVKMNTFGAIEETVVVKGVPLNKWLHILIRVKGVNLDVYVNGVLVQRKVLQSVPLQNNGDVYTTMNGGFNGYLSDLRYFESALSPGDILGLVNKGPNLSISKRETSDITNKPPYFSMRWYFQGN
jgi:hypothetical protein